MLIINFLESTLRFNYADAVWPTITPIIYDKLKIFNALLRIRVGTIGRTIKVFKRLPGVNSNRYFDNVIPNNRTRFVIWIIRCPLLLSNVFLPDAEATTGVFPIQHVSFGCITRLIRVSNKFLRLSSRCKVIPLRVLEPIVIARFLALNSQTVRKIMCPRPRVNLHNHVTRGVEGINIVVIFGKRKNRGIDRLRR